MDKTKKQICINENNSCCTTCKNFDHVSIILLYKSKLVFLNQNLYLTIIHKHDCQSEAFSMIKSAIYMIKFISQQWKI